MSERTHAYDVPLLVQLRHCGRQVSGLVGRPMNTPSPVPAPDFSSPQLVPHEMTTIEVEAVVQQFGEAARRAMQGNIDDLEPAVEVGFLFTKILSARSNLGEEKYGGGTLEGRMTFVYEVTDAACTGSGAERLVGVRLYDDLMDYGLDLQDHKTIAKLLETTG